MTQKHDMTATQAPPTAKQQGTEKRGIKSNADADEPICQRCLHIRFFIISVLMLFILGLTAGDKLHFLQAVTPPRVAGAMMIGGIIMASFKILFYWLEKRQDTQNSNLSGEA
jgi:hypothetical protein